MRRAVVVLAVAVAAAAGAAVGSARSGSSRACSSSTLRYAFTPGGPKGFGVFALRVQDGTCPTARRVARAWDHALRRTGRPAHRAADFAFVTLPAQAAQEYRERGRRAKTTVRFVDRVPNG